MREILLYLNEYDKLSGPALLRAPATNLFPKNIYRIGSIAAEVANQLPVKSQLGTLLYIATTLASDPA